MYLLSYGHLIRFFALLLLKDLYSNLDLMKTLIYDTKGSSEYVDTKPSLILMKADAC